MDDFAGRVAVVTGGASGIGLALAQRFGAEGMRVVVGDIEQEALAAAVAGLEADGVDVLGVECDVSDAEQMQALAAAALDRYGAVHVFCNNAGVGTGGLSYEAPIETWRWVLDVNLWGPIHGVRTFVPILMRNEDAHIVNTASVAGLVAPAFMGPYNVAKHGVVALSETLFHELAMAGSGVKVHVLCPGWVNTRIAEAERNRPDRYSAAAETDTGLTDVLRGFLAAGMDPAEVAGKVVDALRANRFWILTHDSDAWMRAITQLHESVRTQSNPEMFVPGI
jgi:NAD(P)-dependent dehydrogenase (short-subunit alcohol dehydrogenase family)